MLLPCGVPCGGHAVDGNIHVADSARVRDAVRSARYGVAWCGMVWFGAVWHGTALYGKAR
eukprot:125130-Lingulodinium_polyedra.AAC.1